MGQTGSTQDDYSSDSSFSEEEEAEENRIDETQQINPVEHHYNDYLSLDSPTIDAAPPTSTMPIILNLDQVLQIENNLDIYEKVSLGYLLFDDAKSALDQITKLVDGKNTEKIIYNWAIRQNLNGFKWAEKLVEALCIIQNYQVLTNIGYKREDLDVRFLPHHSFTFVYISKIRKALYFICEDFIQSDVEKLVDVVCPDFHQRSLPFKIFNLQYLELYFLYWETVGYITPDNLSNLCRVLKQIDKLDHSESLKQLVPYVTSTNDNSAPKREKNDRNTKSTKKSQDTFDKILDPNASLSELTSFESPISADNAAYVSSENKYHIDPKNPGICLIINQENFYRDVEKSVQHLLPPPGTKLESRLGTSHDKQKLIDTFGKFNYKIVVEENLSHSEMVESIKNVIKSITDESSLFICIMSHGDEGVVYGVNSCKINVTTIKSLICSINRENLSGKPKVLILQSCQGTVCQKITSNDDDDNNITLDGPTTSVLREVVPPTADIFTFWATVPGYGAIRNVKTGSWFIQTLCEKMVEDGHKYHFEDICTSVIGDVTTKIWNQPGGQVAMVPMKDSTFRKLLYLPTVN